MFGEGVLGRLLRRRNQAGQCCSELGIKGWERGEGSLVRPSQRKKGQDWERKESRVERKPAGEVEGEEKKNAERKRESLLIAVVKCFRGPRPTLRALCFHGSLSLEGGRDCSPILQKTSLRLRGVH